MAYRRLSLTRRTGNRILTAQLDSWTDLRGGRERRSGGADVWPDLKNVLAKNDLAAARLLSASGYHSWRGRLLAKRDEVTPGRLADGSDVISIRTVALGSAPVDAILEAGLVVRTRDWHPVRQSLRVRRTAEIDEFEVSELSDVLTERSRLDPAIFGQPAKASLPAPPGPVPVRPTPALHIPPEPPIDLDETELLATLALHRAGACLGEPISVQRGEADVVVRGLVERNQRKEALTVSLAAVPNVKVEIETAEEVAAEAGALSAASVPIQEPPLRSGRIPIEKQLGARMSGQELTSLANRLVSISSEWVAHAWALRHLHEAWAEDKSARLSVPSQWLLEGIFREHLLALGERVRLYRALLEPHLPLAATGSVPGSAPARVWDTNQLLKQTQDAQSWTCSLFAGTDTSAPASAETVAGLAGSLSALEDGLRRMQNDVAQFVKVSNQSSSREKP